MTVRMRLPLSLGCALLLVIICHLAGCSSELPPRKPTTPVTGVIRVDGAAPGSPLQIVCHKLDGIDAADHTVSQAHSDNDGEFALSTYQQGDGVPAGEYALTVTWGKLNPVSMSYSNDAFKGRYNDPKTSQVKFTVKDADEPIDLGTIELSTK
jgi:hypothetical protein